MIDAKDMFSSFDYEEKHVKSIDDTIDELLEDNDIRSFVVDNDLSHEAVIKGVNILLEYKDDTKVLKDGKKESKKYPGYFMVLTYKNNRINYSFQRINPELDYLKNIKTISVPKEALDATFNDFSLVTDERKKAYNYARIFASSYSSSEKVKGMYLSGRFRCGKTYLASAIAKEVASKGHSVIEVYYPEFSSQLKSTFSDSSNTSFNDLVEELKNCDLLIFDDFGGEAINPFIRDEALGVVLQYRMVKMKGTIFTSNIPINKLADTTLRKDGSEGEKIKAQRIVERIKELTEEFYLSTKYEEN